MASSNPAPERPGKCPICGRPTDAHYRPFCSLGGGYAIPVEEDADEDGERAPPADSGGEDDPGRRH